MLSVAKDLISLRRHYHLHHSSFSLIFFQRRECFRERADIEILQGTDVRERAESIRR